MQVLRRKEWCNERGDPLVMSRLACGKDCNTDCNMCNILQCTATLCINLQHTATHCNTLQYTATKEEICWSCRVLPVVKTATPTATPTATHGNTLQHTATHCTTLHHAATHCSTLQHAATHCNTLQYTATHCNTLQHTATKGESRWLHPAVKTATHCNILQHTATHCNTLQHTATHCNALQHTAAVGYILLWDCNTNRCVSIGLFSWNQYIHTYDMKVIQSHELWYKVTNCDTKSRTPLGSYHEMSVYIHMIWKWYKVTNCDTKSQTPVMCTHGTLMHEWIYTYIWINIYIHIYMNKKWWTNCCVSVGLLWMNKYIHIYDMKVILSHAQQEFVTLYHFHIICMYILISYIYYIYA